MPRPFLELSLAQFSDLLQHFPWTRKITQVHMHHTWRPNHANFAARPPIQAIEGMFTFHTTQRGFSDIAQHITIDPRGVIWTGRNWNQPPASATGFNGNSTAGPFMFEMIGDFDSGADLWEGDQRDVAIEVIARVQKLWGLAPADFKLHNEMSPKSCPGSGINKPNVIELVKLAHDRLAVPRTVSVGPGIPKERGVTDTILQLLNANTTPRAVGDDGELPETEMTVRDIEILSGAPATLSRDGDMSALTPSDFDLLRKHVVNLRMGALSTGGLFHTDPADIDAIFAEHLPKFMETHPKLRLVFYAHGGLNDEEGSLKAARNRISFYLQNGCYPIFFVWETGAKETLVDILRDIIGLGPAREVAPAERGFLVTLTDFSDSGLEIAFSKGGTGMWVNMKRSAELSFLPRQGGTLFADKLAVFWREHNASMEMHAIGHSAGSIFHAYFLNLLCSLPANPPIEVKTLHYLAPAITVDLFNETLKPLIGTRIRKLTEYTMRKDLELADAVGPYRKSLLYLVSRSFEGGRETPILGLEESIRRDPDMIRFFGLLGNKPKAEILFSASENGPSHSTISKSHGDFDNDRLTMGSVMRRILEVTDQQSIVEFPETVSRNILSSAPKPIAKPAAAMAAQPSPAPPSPKRPSPVPVTAVSTGSGSGRRIALCIGIDEYAGRNRLAGCVNDAKAWADTLRRLQFDTTLMVNAEATWDGMRGALQRLVSNAKGGDVLVVQYAGHGTRVPDLDNEAGEIGGKDSAFCPIDFEETGKFLIDDDVREIFQDLPYGVNLTCFFDCCHSGTITRMVAPTPARLGGDVRARGFFATPEMEEAHRRFRQGLSTRGVAAPRGPSTMREISFSACTDVQTAKEIDGHGQFTVRALGVLRNGLNGMTNETFLRDVLSAFAANPVVDQTPGLDCADGSRGLPLLGVLTSKAAGV